MKDPLVSEALVGPFTLEDRMSNSYLKLGDLVHQLKKDGVPGRYPVQGGIGERFAIVMYEDFSWRISTTQYELFEPRGFLGGFS